MSILPINPNVKDNLNTLPDLVRNVTELPIVRELSKPNKAGVSGYVFDIIGTEEMLIDSDITDHFIEDNSAIQDHIALRPERFVLSGYVGELRNLLPNSFLGFLTTAQSLGTIFDFAPDFPKQATQIYNEISDVAAKVGEVYNQAANIYEIFFQKSTTENRQQEAFQYFYNLWLSRQLCEVETPYGILKNVAIESIRVKQDEETRLVSDFSITFKKIRTTRTLQITIDQVASPVASEGRGAQITKEESDNNGSTSGLDVDDLLLSNKYYEILKS